MDLINAESAYSNGKAQFDKWLAKDEERWNRPMIRTEINIFLNTLTPEQREQFAPQIKLIKSKLGLEKENADATSIHWQGGSPEQGSPVPSVPYSAGSDQQELP